MLRLLLVEDDPSVRRAMDRRLRASGVHAVLAATLGEGIAALDGCDIVIVDLNLPDGCGTDLLRLIRLASRPVRVAIYTGAADAEAIVARSGERPNALFRKPADLDRVLAWVA